MRPITMFFTAVLMVAGAFSSGWSQTGERVGPQGVGSAQPNPPSDAAETSGTRTTAAELPEESTVWVHLVGGRRIQVDEVMELADGFWYKRGNVSTFLERSSVARVERVSATKAISLTNPSLGSSTWSISDSARVESFFRDRFGRGLPLGAFGQSYLHTRWGLDHRNGMDVSLHPDSPEGRTLISFLRNEGIPYLAFRGPIPRVATGPHIHVGNASHRLSGRR